MTLMWVTVNVDTHDSHQGNRPYCSLISVWEDVQSCCSLNEAAVLLVQSNQVLKVPKLARWMLKTSSNANTLNHCSYVITAYCLISHFILRYTNVTVGVISHQDQRKVQEEQNQHCLHKCKKKTKQNTESLFLPLISRRGITAHSVTVNKAN